MTKPWYRPIVDELAPVYGLDPDVVEAVIRVESGGKADAFRFEPAFYERYLKGKAAYAGQEPRRVSSSYGLMQVMYPVALERGYQGEPEGLFVPRTAIEYGCRQLAHLLEWSHGNVHAALAAYNGGMSKNDKPPYRNATYVAKVMAALAEVQQ